MQLHPHQLGNQNSENILCLVLHEKMVTSHHEMGITLFSDRHRHPLIEHNPQQHHQLDCDRAHVQHRYLLFDQPWGNPI